MFLQKGFQHLKTKQGAVLRAPLATGLRASVIAPMPMQFQARPYFSIFEKIKDRFRTPIKHIQGFAAPDGMAA